jgi:hypothetical protein
MWTPGSRPVPAWAEAVEKLIATTAKALTTNTPTAHTGWKITV